MAARTDHAVLRAHVAGVPDLGSARGALRRHLDALGWHDPAIDTAVLVTSELATNGLQHAGPPVHVDVDVHDCSARISVHDRSHDAPSVRERGGEHGGFGMRLVERASTAWGWHPTDDGKVVWADICDVQSL